MTEDDKKGLKQTELLHDIVFDASLPLKAPPRPKTKRPPATYSPHSDPDTIDLFGDMDLRELDDEFDSESFDRTEEALIEQGDQQAEETARALNLRHELASDLSQILNDLNTRD